MTYEQVELLSRAFTKDFRCKSQGQSRLFKAFLRHQRHRKPQTRHQARLGQTHFCPLFLRKNRSIFVSNGV
jgi:hypothetical protein